MNIVTRKIDKLGRIVLPMDFRKALALDTEANVILSVDGNTITVKSANNSCKLCGSNVEVSKKFTVCSKCIRKINSV